MGIIQGTFVPLDDYYSSVTYLEVLRPVKALSLADRPRGSGSTA